MLTALYVQLSMLNITGAANCLLNISFERELLVSDR